MFHYSILESTLHNASTLSSIKIANCLITKFCCHKTKIHCSITIFHCYIIVVNCTIPSHSGSLLHQNSSLLHHNSLFYHISFPLSQCSFRLSGNCDPLSGPWHCFIQFFTVSWKWCNITSQCPIYLITIINYTSQWFVFPFPLTVYNSSITLIHCFFTMVQCSPFHHNDHLSDNSDSLSHNNGS